MHLVSQALRSVYIPAFRWLLSFHLTTNYNTTKRNQNERFVLLSVQVRAY
jgi:hypothetical protein